MIPRLVAMSILCNAQLVDVGEDIDEDMPDEQIEEEAAAQESRNALAKRIFHSLRRDIIPELDRALSKKVPVVNFCSFPPGISTLLSHTFRPVLVYEPSAEKMSLLPIFPNFGISLKFEEKYRFWCILKF